MRHRFANTKKASFDINNYFTIEALESGLQVSFSYSDQTKQDAEYSINGGIWTNLKHKTLTPAINKGQTISFRGYLVPLDHTGIGTFSVSKQFYLKGNCMSLLYGDNTSKANTLVGYDYVFDYMMSYCNGLIEVSENFLPATVLSKGCYNGMFNECKNLIKGPCLPAKTLVSSCYDHMYAGCSKLNYIKALFTTTPSSSYTQAWVSGVASTGTFVKNPDATWDVIGFSGVPSGWTVQNATS